MARHEPAFDVKAFPDFLGVHVPERERRYWSPHLLLSLKPLSPTSTLVEGIYGPECEVWSVFLYGYLVTGLLGTFSGILGIIQRNLEMPPWGLWVCGTMALGAILLYFFAQLGQKLGARQTFQLHLACEAAIGQSAEIS